MYLKFILVLFFQLFSINYSLFLPIRPIVRTQTIIKYVCNKSVNPLPQINSVVNGICPKINATNKKLLWLDLDKRSQYCYWFSVDYNMHGMGRVSWADASFQCRERNGTLASIHNNHDLSLLRNKISNSYTNTWIGLYKVPNG
jgi:hypothetical protein